jgi:cytochrome P450
MDLLGQGLVTSEGEKWERQRRLLAPAFRGSSLQHVASAGFEAARRMLQPLQESLQTSQVSQVIEWNGLFRALTLQVIAGSIMSLSAEESDAVLPRLYLPIVDEANKRTWQPWRWLLPNSHYSTAVRQLNEFVTRIIEQRWKDRATRFRLARSGMLQLDILDRLLFAMFAANTQAATASSSLDQTSEDASNATEGADDTSLGFDISEAEAAAQQCPAWATSQLRDEIKTFLLAGHETSSLMLTWALYEITQHPEVEARVYAEACNVFPDPSFAQMPDYKSFRGLSYTEAVLKEALRKYSVVPVVTREAVNTETVEGVTLPSGCTIVIPIRFIHSRPDLWGDPENFRPERWEQRINAWQFLGFLQGPRFCIGQQFALLEGKIVLAMIIRLFKVSSCRSTDAQAHRYIIPVPPNTGMRLFIERREGAQ